MFQQLLVTPRDDQKDEKEKHDVKTSEEQNSSPDSLRPSQNSHQVEVAPVVTKPQGEIDQSKCGRENEMKLSLKKKRLLR